MNGEPHRGPRGRVVMLVDNAVNGDSRVQKAARTMAEAGWEVVLLGRARPPAPDGTLFATEWMLGDAQVRLLALGGPKTGLPAPKPPLTVRRAVKLPIRWLWHRLPRPTRVRLRRPLDNTKVWYWQRRMGVRAWRRLEPSLMTLEKTFGPVVDKLAPDLIHANDFRMLGVGARAAERARQAGREIKLVWDAHEFLPGIKPWGDRAHWLPAHRAHEQEYAPAADAVITVSTELAKLLQLEHGLVDLPKVVLNAPDLSVDGSVVSGDQQGIRALCAIGPDSPLVVYSGVAAPQRGLAVMIEALPLLPEMHVAFVVNLPNGEFVSKLRLRAAALGAADRLHVLDYVPADRVVGFLSEADAGVIPIHHWLNHEIALITKFFEYSHARLPIIVSDVRTMSETVRRTGQGEVFPAEKVDGFVQAVRKVLADPEKYRAAYAKPGLLEEWTWRVQAAELDRIYSKLLGVPSTPAA